jgi:hypothetical protein
LCSQSDRKKEKSSKGEWPHRLQVY